MRKVLRVAIVWNGTVITDRVFEKPTQVVVGESRRAHLSIPGLGDEYTLFEPASGEYSLRVSAAMQGRNFLESKPVDTAKLLAGKKSASIPIKEDDWGLLTVNDIGLLWQFINLNERVPHIPFIKRIEMPLVATMAIAAALQLSFLLMCRLVMDDDPQLREVEVPDRFVRFLQEKPKDDVIDEIIDVTDEKESEVKAPPGPDTDSTPRDEKMSDRVKQHGIHKALTSDLLSAGALKDMFGDRTGFDTRLAVAMDASGDVVGMGSGGMGMRGGGGGGGGFGQLQGFGSVGGQGGGGVKANLAGRGRTKVKAGLKRGEPDTAGFCSPADIQRVVGQRQRGIRNCYEQQLQRDPSLSGQVTLNWVIDLDGTVANARVATTTLNNAAVEQCMVNQARRWRFREPDGGRCSVNYPFVFTGGL